MLTLRHCHVSLAARCEIVHPDQLRLRYIAAGRWTDLPQEVLAGESDAGKILLQVVVRESVHLDLARPAYRHANASHGFGLHALDRQRDELQAQVFHLL